MPLHTNNLHRAPTSKQQEQTDGFKPGYEPGTPKYPPSIPPARTAALHGRSGSLLLGLATGTHGEWASAYARFVSGKWVSITQSPFSTHAETHCNATPVSYQTTTGYTRDGFRQSVTRVGFVNSIRIRQSVTRVEIRQLDTDLRLAPACSPATQLKGVP